MGTTPRASEQTVYGTLSGTMARVAATVSNGVLEILSEWPVRELPRTHPCLLLIRPDVPLRVVVLHLFPAVDFDEKKAYVGKNGDWTVIFEGLDIFNQALYPCITIAECVVDEMKEQQTILDALGRLRVGTA